MRHLLLVLIGAGILAGDADGVVTPGARNAHAMIFDERNGVTVLFGGASESAVLADTWTWDGARWLPRPVVGPSARTFPSFAWDAARSEGVLFGGRSVLFGREGQRGTCLGDTWVLRDGWHRAANGPPARCEAGIAYDRDRRVTVLFGGYSDANGAIARLGDTWEWDGATWRLRAEAGPAPRSGVAMAYDERLRRVVLFGGNGGPRSDTWTWDGARWVPVNTPETPGRFNSVAAFTTALKRIVRTTGWNGKERVSETWLFDADGWRPAPSGGPGPRNHSAVAFDRLRDRLVLYGGHDGTSVFADTWEWDGMRWTERIGSPPRRRVENGH